MNKMIDKMVDLLFSDIEETEEVRVLRAELLSDCREHYADLLRGGASEEEALYRVRESLSGMEEVLNTFPKKKKPLIAVSHFDPDKADKLSIHTNNTDIVILPSADGCFHMDLTDSGYNIDSANNGDTLEVRLVPVPNADAAAAQSAKVFYKDEQGIYHVDFVALKDKILGCVQQAANSCFSDGGTLTVSVPMGCFRVIQAHSASGDIRLSNCGAEEVSLSSASGDIECDAPAKRMNLSSTSGDIGCGAPAEQMNASTTSGDIELTGAVGTLRAQSTSGDITADNILTGAEAFTVSGDIECGSLSPSLDTAILRSTSGDITFRCPANIPLAIKAHTVSGDMSVARPNTPGAKAGVTLQTVSGDIDVK